jgi:hypothetical protein
MIIMNLIKLYILFVPLAVLVFSEIYIFWPELLFISVIISEFIIFYTLWRMGRVARPNKNWPMVLILPLVFNACLAGFTILLANRYAVHFCLLLNTVFLYLYFRLIFGYWFKKSDRTALKEVSAYGSFLTVFFLGSALYGLFSYLNLTIWILMLAGLGLIILLAAFILWWHEIPLRSLAVVVPLIGLMLFELAWAIIFLPVKYYIAGFILAVNFYLAVNIISYYYQGNLSKNIIWRYLGFGFGCVALVLLTSRWL